MESLNAQLDMWIHRVRRRRQVPSDRDRRLVRDALVLERVCLLPLPEHPALTDPRPIRRLGEAPYVRFDRNDRPIPHTHVRKPLTLVASETEVCALDGPIQIARHLRSYDAHQQIEDERHLGALITEKRRARGVPRRGRRSGP